jgi:predicted phage terminase large subunit-like protein
MDNLEIVKRLLNRKPEYGVISDLFEMGRIIEKDDFGKAMEINKDVRRICVERVKSGQDAEQFYQLYKKALLFDAPHEFEAFLLYVDFDKEPGRRFYLPRRKSLKPIVDAFQEVSDGLLDLLTVSQPKRTGKTTTGLMYTSWKSGQRPERSSICSGSGDDLVTSFYEGCLDMFRNDVYGFTDVFPAATLEHTNADKHTINLQERKRFATITCRSIDGALTGSTEATNLLYLDDLVKDDMEAKNRVRLDTLWDKVRGDLLGRRLEGCPIIAQGTRYSIYDPIGRLIEIAPSMGWRYKVLEIPALNEKDESNFEMTDGEGRRIFTTEYFRNERNLLSPEQWESQFQQQPFEARGLMFPPNELKYYFKLPDKPPDAVIAACDTAESGKDSVCMPIAYLYGDDVMVEDVVFNNSPPEITKPICAKMLFNHKVQTAEFESNNAGEYFAKDVEKALTSLGGRTSIRTRRSISNKLTRIEFASDGVKKNFYFKDKSLYSPQSDYGLFMRELTTFTRTGKVAHDDAPDGIAMLENMIRRTKIPSIEVFTRPF